MEQDVKTDTSGKVLYSSFIACLLIISLPIKNAAYLAAPAYLAIQLVRGQHRCLVRTFVLATVLLSVSALSLFWEGLRNNEINLPGMLLAFLTYLSFIVLIAERHDKLIDEKLFRRFVTLACWFVIIQSMIGFVQFAISRNSDAVSGTFGLFDIFGGQITISQVFFTFTMFAMIALIFLAPLNALSIFSILLGLITCALAQSGHQTIFLVGSLAVLGITRINRPSTFVMTSAVAGILVAITLAVYPSTPEWAGGWVEKVVYSSSSPKRMAVEGGITTLSDAKNLALGTGLGQYSSRAALITSDTHLSVPLPSFMVGESRHYGMFIAPAIQRYEHVGEGSAMSKPYFSWLSFLVELGLIQFLILLGIIVCAFAQNWRLTRTRLRSVERIGFVANVGLLFFLLCCLVENYAEFPQATFIPFLLYIAIVSRARTELAQTQRGRVALSGA